MNKIIFFIVTASLLAACYQTELYNTNHPDAGVVVVKVDNLDSATGESYTVVIDGEQIEVGADGSVTFPDTFNPGEYTAYVYNDPEDTSVVAEERSVIASVDLIDASTISAQPSILYFGEQRFTVAADGFTTTKVEMVQITRELNFSLELDGDAISRIEKISAILDGVSQQWDCVNDQHYGDSYSVVPTLSQVTPPISMSRTEGKTMLSGRIYLLGINPTAEQTLTITLEYKDDNPQKNEVVVSNISTQLSTFNSNKSAPFELTGTVETPTEVGATGSIINWNENKKSDVTVD